MRVSVLTIAYNAERTLERALRSVRANECPVEVVVVDDGSTDATAGIAETWADVLVRLSQNRGRTAARNAGLLNCTGDMVQIVDADDWIAPDFLMRMLEVSDEADVIVPAVQAFGVLHQRWTPHIPELNEMWTAFDICGSSMLRRTALLECGGWNGLMVHGYEDFDLLWELRKRKKRFVACPEAVYHYALKPGYDDKPERTTWREWNQQRIHANHLGHEPPPW